MWLKSPLIPETSPDRNGLTSPERPVTSPQSRETSPRRPETQPDRREASPQIPDRSPTRSGRAPKSLFGDSTDETEAVSDAVLFSKQMRHDYEGWLFIVYPFSVNEPGPNAFAKAKSEGTGYITSRHANRQESGPEP
jgi:hypothetical protein